MLQSGTLCLEYISNPHNMKCIQVSTPAPIEGPKRSFAKLETVTEDLNKVNANEKWLLIEVNQSILLVLEK